MSRQGVGVLLGWLGIVAIFGVGGGAGIALALGTSTPARAATAAGVGIVVGALFLAIGFVVFYTGWRKS